jgi:hypothetical protein
MSLRLVAVALAATLATVTPAAAATIDFTDIFDPGSVFLRADGSNQCVGTNIEGTTVGDSVAGTLCESLTFTQSLTGYVSPPNVLQSATLQIFLIDDANDPIPGETFTVTGDLTNLWTNLAVVGGGDPTAPISVFALLAGDGLLNLIVSATSGDFHFDKAILNATWLDRDEEEPPPVPEPASLLLLGAGAIAVAYQVRKAKRS